MAIDNVERMCMSRLTLASHVRLNQTEPESSQCRTKKVEETIAMWTCVIIVVQLHRINKQIFFCFDLLSD